MFKNYENLLQYVQKGSINYLPRHLWAAVVRELHQGATKRSRGRLSRYDFRSVVANIATSNAKEYTLQIRRTFTHVITCHRYSRGTPFPKHICTPRRSPAERERERERERE
ncbi:hypothetical protein EVAR_41657_1 [Eumeta japonica]|uniref:Uncharacterized protein n=1 Tax=Eumeta variegata TaxID=151549 RepID=A0A4C1VQE8_EUMVA|nr:hypothetical protein EVAR_41657_1 [Eumeta japonica]